MSPKVRFMHATAAAVAAAVGLLALSQTWLNMRIAPPGLPTLVEAISGASLAPLASAALLAVLAASLALLALRRWAVYLVVLIYFFSAAVCVSTVVGYVRAPLDRAIAVSDSLIGPETDVQVEASPYGAVFLVATSVALIWVGVSLIWQSRREPARPGAKVRGVSKYEKVTPKDADTSTSSASADIDAQSLWDAQDVGVDLTTDKSKN